MRGVISCLPVRKPTIQEIETCRWIPLKSEVEWDPHSDDFAENERKAQDNENIIMNVERDIFTVQISQYAAQVSDRIMPGSLMSEDELLPRVIKSVKIQNVRSGQREGRITRENKAKMWKIGLDAAASTLKATTQLVVRHALHPLHKRFRTEAAQLRYPCLGGRFGRFSSDTMFAKTKSIRGNMMAQIFSNDIDFTKLIPMERKGEGDSLMEFIHDTGIPSEIHTDGSKEQTLGKWKEIIRKFDIKHTMSEPYSPWQVGAERSVREVKKFTQNLMNNTKALKCLWDYCAVYACEIRCITVHPNFAAQGHNPYEFVTGRTPNFSGYDLLWYYDQDDFPADRRRLGRWLGVAHQVGQACCYYILPSSGQPIVGLTVQRITEDERKTTDFQEKQKAYDLSIET
jgi:hypothetical protein